LPTTALENPPAESHLKSFEGPRGTPGALNNSWLGVKSHPISPEKLIAVFGYSGRLSISAVRVYP